jgi:hypothetical protein
MYGKLDWRMYYISFQAHSHAVIILSIELIGVFAFLLKYGTIIRCGIFFCQFTISAVSRSIYTKFGTNFLHVIVVLPFCKKTIFRNLRNYVFQPFCSRRSTDLHKILHELAREEKDEGDF